MIDRADIEQAQATWAGAIVEIGAASSWDEAHDLATRWVQALYLLEDSSLLFGPTKAADQQFRSTLKEAVSYFVGRDPDLAEDNGFALQPWSSVRFENHGIVCRDGVGIAMGNYFFGQSDGSELKVEFSFVYVRNAQGQLKIQLHHSALPYSP